MALSNIGLNYLLVFGKGGFPAMGISGAAIATVISELLSLVYLLGWVRMKRLPQQFGLHRFLKPQLDGIVNIAKVSAPIVVQNLMAICTWFIFFLMIEGLGERALAVSNVVRSGYMILMIPIIGIGQATQTLVSTLIGQGGTDLVGTLVKRLISISFAASLVLVVANALLPEAVIQLFTNDTEILQASLPIMLVVSVGIMIFSVAMVLISVVSGSGNTLITMFIEMATISVYMLYIILSVKVFKFPLVKIWYAEPIYFVCLAIFATIYLWTGRWKNKQVHE
jgi:Na+-driven multidrug efflux pump